MLSGHRREVNILALDQSGVDRSTGRLLLAATGKDRKISLWDAEAGKMLGHVNDAHNRLITG